MSALGTLGILAQRTGGRVIGDAAVVVEHVAATEDVDATALTFATDERYLRAALASPAAAVLVEETLVAGGATYSKPLLAVPSVRLALAVILRLLEPPRPAPGIHPSAAIDPTASVDPGATIGAQVAIGPRSRIGPGTVVGAGVVVGASVVIGADCTLHPRAVVQDACRLGDRVVLHPGAVIGSDGFGWAFVEGALRKIPQIGTVELADNVEIGANTCVDRAQTGVTSIGEGTKIDNLVQIGHNCRIGKHCAFAGQTGLAGSTIVGDYVQVGGQSAFKGHITVGSRVTLAGGSHVWGDIPEGGFYSGQPARKHREELRGQALLRKLPNLFARVDALERDPKT